MTFYKSLGNVFRSDDYKLIDLKNFSIENDRTNDDLAFMSDNDFANINDNICAGIL